MLQRLAVFSVLSYTALSFLLPKPAQAQETPTTTFSLQPALVELKVDPGHSSTFSMKLTNLSKDSQAVKVYTRDFTAKGIDGEITFGDEDPSSYAASQWLTLSEQNLILESGAEKEVSVQVVVPTNAEPGGHYASVLLEQVKQDIFEQGNNSHVNLAARMAGLVYITVSGDIREAGQVLGADGSGKCSAVVCGFSVPKFADSGPVPMSFVFNNTGNVHVKPKGTVKVYQFGRLVDTIEVPDKTVLPNAQRIFEMSWQRKILIGPYTAKLHLVYGSKDYAIDMEAKMWAFPWQAALVVLTITALSIGIFVLRKHYRVQRLIKHMD